MPRNPELIIFLKTMAPTFPGVAEAPMTAIERGRKGRINLWPWTRFKYKEKDGGEQVPQRLTLNADFKVPKDIPPPRNLLFPAE